MMGRYLCAVRSHVINIGRHMATQQAGSGRLHGKVALVTGSTEGIGYAIARRLAQDGAKVVVNSRKEAKVNKTVEILKGEGHTVEGIPGHAGKKEARQMLVQQTLDKFGRLDILVPNVGTNPVYGPILTVTTEEIWDKLFDTNVKSAFFLVKEAFPHMVKQGGGSVTFVSSVAGRLPIEHTGAYSVTKTALLGLTQALVAQCSPLNIRVNCISPGIIPTKFSRVFTEHPDSKDALANSIPLHRPGTGEECAAAVAFLASDDASYITGENIAVDGGIGRYVNIGPDPSKLQ